MSALTHYRSGAIVWADDGTLRLPFNRGTLEALLERIQAAGNTTGHVTHRGMKLDESQVLAMLAHFADIEAEVPVSLRIGGAR